MPDTYLRRSFGATPTTTPETGETTLASLDPARDVLLDLFKAAIIAEAGARWTAAAVGTPLEGRLPVESPIPDEPDPQLLGTEMIKFPALFVYRSREPATFNDYTLSERRRTSRFHVDYMLGPLDAGARRKLKDMLTFVEDKIENVIQAGGHRAYLTATTASGFSRAANVLVGTGSLCKFLSINAMSAGKGPASFSDAGPFYWAVSAILTVEELANSSGGDFDEVPMQGSTLTTGTGNSDGLVPDLIQAKTYG